MTTAILVLHLLIALALVGVVLLQRSEGGGLGIGGGGGGGGAFMSGRGAANLLTRATAILAAGFIATSITLAVLSGSRGSTNSVVDGLPDTAQPTESGGPVVPQGQ